VVVGTVLVKFFGLSEQGVAIVGAVPAGLPAPSIPFVDSDMVSMLLPMAIAISLVSYMESISVAKNFARKAKYEVDPNQELVGLGLANVAGSFFGAYPVTGGFSRTAVNAEAGAKTPIAAVITALVVALALMFFTPLFYSLPKSVLAGIIMAAVFGLIDIHEAKHLWKINKADFWLMAITFFATLSLGIEMGILVGVGASMAWVFYKLSNPHVARLGRLPGTDIYRNIERNPDAVVLPGVLAVRIDAPLFFANAVFLKETLKKLEAEKNEQICAVVLDARPVTDFDSSALAVFKELVEDYLARNVDVYVANTWGPVHDKLKLAGITDLLGEGHIVAEVREAMSHLEREPCCTEES
jgi:SulP family sulfate permease